MDLSLADLEQAVSIRRHISALESRLASLLGRRAGTAKTGGGRRQLSPAARAKIAAAARARWARERARRGRSKTTATRAPRKRRLSAAGRKRLSDLMKARWAERRKAERK
jgi:hypothetical protein